MFPLESIFTYHSPTADQVDRMKKIREKAFELATLIEKSCPVATALGDVTISIQKVREAVMFANASIVLGE